jgi:RNA polymerase sigma-70 factor, ECF subfamily
MGFIEAKKHSQTFFEKFVRWRSAHAIDGQRMSSTTPDSELLDEDALILLVKGGDVDAFEPLVDRYLPNIRAFLALRAPAVHLVDELAHETFVYAFRNIGDFTPGTSLLHWLRAIAGNLLRAETQRFSREQANQLRFAEAQRLAPIGESLPGESDEAELLRQCVEELPGTMRTLISLKYRQDRSSEQIAQELERSMSWVWTMLFRVRQQLKACLQRKLGRNQSC